MPLTRREDWPERLHAAVELGRRTPFAWGRFDCMLWACDAVLAMTHVDWAAGWRGTYDNAISAARQLRTLGFRDLPELAAKYAADYACPAVAVKMAQRGDIVMVETTLGPALGVCIGASVAVAAPAGLGFLPLADADRAWRI